MACIFPCIQYYHFSDLESLLSLFSRWLRLCWSDSSLSLSIQNGNHPRMLVALNFKRKKPCQAPCWLLFWGSDRVFCDYANLLTLICSELIVYWWIFIKLSILTISQSGWLVFPLNNLVRSITIIVEQPREVGQLAQGHSAGHWQSLISNFRAHYCDKAWHWFLQEGWPLITFFCKVGI